MHLLHGVSPDGSLLAFVGLHVDAAAAAFTVLSAEIYTVGANAPATGRSRVAGRRLTDRNSAPTLPGYEIARWPGSGCDARGVSVPVREARLGLDVVSAGVHWRVRFDAGAPAQPVVIERMDGDASAPIRERCTSRVGRSLRPAPQNVTPVTVDTGFLADLEVAERLLPIA